MWAPLAAAQVPDERWQRKAIEWLRQRVAMAEKFPVLEARKWSERMLGAPALAQVRENPPALREEWAKVWRDIRLLREDVD